MFFVCDVFGKEEGQTRRTETRKQNHETQPTNNELPTHVAKQLEQHPKTQATNKQQKTNISKCSLTAADHKQRTKTNQPINHNDHNSSNRNQQEQQNTHGRPAIKKTA